MQLAVYPSPGTGLGILIWVYTHLSETGQLETETNIHKITLCLDVINIIFSL